MAEAQEKKVDEKAEAQALWEDKRKRHLQSMFGERKGAKLFDAEKKAGFKNKAMWPYTVAGRQ